MKVHYFTGMTVEDTKKYSDKVEDLIDHHWRGKAARLQNRRWKKINEEEQLSGRYGHHHRSHR